MDVFDNVKFEKAKAMERYTRFQNLMKLLQLFELIVAISVISWSWTRVPSAVKFTGEVLVQLSGYIFKPHVVFLIGNGIIVAIVVLCRQNDSAVSDSSVEENDEIHVSEVPASSLALPPPQTAELTAVITAEQSVTTAEVKEIVSSENLQCDDVAETIDIAKKQILKFKRTQSEKLKREITSNPRRQLRRSETDTRRKLKVPEEEEAVDTMSNEEFRLTIEAFIKKNQIFFEKQRRAESKYEPKGIEAF